MKGSPALAATPLWLSLKRLLQQLSQSTKLLASAQHRRLRQTNSTPSTPTLKPWSQTHEQSQTCTKHRAALLPERRTAKYGQERTTGSNRPRPQRQRTAAPVWPTSASAIVGSSRDSSSFLLWESQLVLVLASASHSTRPYGATKTTSKFNSFLLSKHTRHPPWTSFIAQGLCLFFGSIA